MQEEINFGILKGKFAVEFSNLNSELEALSSLYRNLPVSESCKKLFLEKTLKSKSAWYACLVNSNIDVLLLPEYLESKQSRNILIKKETEQYFQSLSNFNLLTVNSNPAIYDCILYSEDVEPKSSFDLFSSQVPESAQCPLPLKKLFDRWERLFVGYSPLEYTCYAFFDWLRFNKFSFSGQRQSILWLNYQLWKQYGNVFQRLGIETFLFQNWNKNILYPEIAMRELLTFIHKEISAHLEGMKELYRSEIAFDEQKSRQKIVSNHLFETGFKLGIINNASTQTEALLKIILRKGYICINDFVDRAEAEKLLPEIEKLIQSGIIISAREEGEICMYLNTSLKNKQSRLFSFQNLQIHERSIPVQEFIQQSFVKAIIPIEKPAIPEPVMIQSREKRHKAFFG